MSRHHRGFDGADGVEVPVHADAVDVAIGLAICAEDLGGKRMERTLQDLFLVPFLCHSPLNGPNSPSTTPLLRYQWGEKKTLEHLWSLKSGLFVPPDSVVYATTHHFSPAGQIYSVVIKDDEPDILVRAVSQGRAQILRDEISLQLRCEPQALEGVVGHQSGARLVLCRQRPEGHVVLGVRVKEPGGEE